MRVWVKENNETSTPHIVTVWAVYFDGLVYLGSQLPKEASLFTKNTIIFGMSWGFFTAEKSLKSPLNNPQITLSLGENTSKSYSLSSMCRWFDS